MFFRILLKIFEVQFFFFMIFVACSLIAGEQNAPFWFILISLTPALTVAGAIVRNRR